MNTIAAVRTLAASVVLLAACIGYATPGYAGQCASVNAFGQVTATNESAPDCSSLLLLTSSEVEELRNPPWALVDWEDVQFSAGAVITMFCVGLGLGVVISIIRRAK